MVPRSNRPRGARPEGGEDDDFDLARVLYGRHRVETKRNGRWNVQEISASTAAKLYTCPGCSLPIAASTAHIVAWRADGLMGEVEDLAARRHWHLHCWKIT